MSLPKAKLAEMVSRLCLKFILLCFLSTVGAVCYLEDANADCSVCWKTVYSGPDDSTGVTTMAQCPEGIAVSWETQIPDEMFANTAYPVTYRFSVDEAKFPVYKKGKNEKNHVPHANIHSCIASRGACTPFVANSPGLATHTPAIVGDLEQGGVVDFVSDVKLTPEVYTIIAHVRFYTDNDRDASLPHVKYDVAIGVSREVLPEVVAVSTDSYITTGAIGGILFILIASVAWGARSGRIDIDKVLETVYSEKVTCIISMIGGITDAIAFMVSVLTVMQTDNALVQALPASYFFVCTSVMGSIYVAWTDVLQLKTMYLQHSSREKFLKHVARTQGRNQVQRARRLSLQNNASTETANLNVNGTVIDPRCDKSVNNAINDFESKLSEMGNEEKTYNMLLELEVASRELIRKRGDVVTIFTESIPITAIQIYALNTAEKPPLITIITLVVAVLILGAKVSGLGGYRDARIRRDKAESLFRKDFNIGTDETQPPPSSVDHAFVQGRHDETNGATYSALPSTVSPVPPNEAYVTAYPTYRSMPVMHMA